MTNTISFSDSYYYQTCILYPSLFLKLLVGNAADQLTIDFVLEPKVICAAKPDYELFMVQ